MLMLLCVHMTRVLFLVLVGNSTLTMGSYSSRPFLCALDRLYVSIVCSERTGGYDSDRIKYGLKNYGRCHRYKFQATAANIQCLGRTQY